MPRSVKVYVATQPVSLRKSFDGLSNEAREVLRLNPLSGHIFVFLNRRKNQVKLLMWTRGGFAVIHKRLERGRYASLKDVGPDAKRVEIDVHELSMLLEGITFVKGRTSPRWEPPMHEPAS